MVEPFVQAGYDYSRRRPSCCARPTARRRRWPNEVAMMEAVFKRAGDAPAGIGLGSRAPAFWAAARMPFRRRPRVARLLLHGRHDSPAPPGARA